MSVLLVTYDLNRTGQNYTDLLKFIKTHDAWARLSESSYVIETYETPDDVYNKIKKIVDDNDDFFIISLKQPWQGWGQKR